MVLMRTNARMILSRATNQGQNARVTSMVRGLPAADVERAIAHASAGRLVTLMILTHVLRLLQGRKLPGSILGSSVLLSILEYSTSKRQALAC